MFDSLQPPELQHGRLPWPSSSPEVCPSSFALNRWCHPTISSSVTLCLWSYPASRSSPVNQLFALGGQSIGASASVLPKSIQGWFPLKLIGLIYLLFRGLLRLLQHHRLKASILWCSAFFIVQLSHLYMTAGKTTALTIQTFVSKNKTWSWLWLRSSAPLSKIQASTKES